MSGIRIPLPFVGRLLALDVRLEKIDRGRPIDAATGGGETRHASHDLKVGAVARHLITLCDTLSSRTDRSHWQIGLDAVGSAKFFRDLKSGARRGCHLDTYNRALSWFSDNWPAGLAWPSDIARPEPTRASTPEEAA